MILEDTLNYLGVEPVYDENTEQESQTVVVPDVTGKSLSEAASILREAGLDYLAEQTGTVVTKQMPLPDAEVLINTTVLLYTDSEENGQQLGEDDLIEVPDVTNKSIREANNILVSKGLKLRIEGTGLAVSQQPAPGTRVEPGTTVTVSFEPPQ
jgi:stage V sporulation protein D (sporulation-specific penicillin-binding protein)